MQFLSDVPLSNYTTMRIGGPAKHLCSVSNEAELLEAYKYAKTNNLSILVIGGGSNIIFRDSGYSGLVILNMILGVKIDPEKCTITSGSGELWDNIVEISINNNLVGIESLSLIPGTVGGAPVNNIGAYGQEIKNTVKEIRALDTTTGKIVQLNNDDCKFEYRNSIFKSSEYGRYIIISVEFQLNNFDSENYNPPSYDSLNLELLSENITKPNLANIRSVVIKVRKSKLPDPKLLANTGSFFKNPIVTADFANNLLIKYPMMPVFDYKDTKKIPAGWLIEEAGLKGFRAKGIWVYEKQSLVLVNESAKSFSDLQNMINTITDAVEDKFSIKLEAEPEII